MTTPKATYNLSKGAKEFADNGAFLTIKSMNTKNNIVKFAAFLTSFSQSWSSNWNTEEVYGRIDPIATFQGTKRTVELAFDIPSAFLSQAENAMQQCETLVQFLYPSYVKPKNSKGNKGRIISKPPLVSVKFANLIQENGKGLLGYLSGVEWRPDLEMGMFQRGKGEKAKFYPKVITLSFTLNVLHQYDKGWKAERSATWYGKKFFGG
jgi:hypothetical protein